MPVPVSRQEWTEVFWLDLMWRQESENKRVKFYEIEDNFIWLHLAKNKAGYLNSKRAKELKIPQKESLWFFKRAKEIT